MTKVSGNWLKATATQSVFEMLSIAGYKCFFVGGCVRNALLDEPVNDIDLSTNALPQTVINLAKKAGLRAIPTGIDHGTVTVVSNGIAHEITTFRKDVETDGRHANVVFSNDIAEDAKRRDFTLNAIYCDRKGGIVDPLNGMPDLKNRRIAFILDPTQRIKEDYLRILRFFRFYAWYGDPQHGIDSEGLAACASNLDGLHTLSKERVSSEILKLLSAKNPAASLAAMEQSGVLAQILPGATTKTLPVLIHFEEAVNAAPNPLRRLASLGLFNWDNELRLSKKQTKQLNILKNGLNENQSPLTLGYLFGPDLTLDIILLKSAMLELPLPDDMLSQIEKGSQNKFPIQACDLMPKHNGKALGKKLKRLEALWLSSDMKATKPELLNSVDQSDG